MKPQTKADLKKEQSRIRTQAKELIEQIKEAKSAQNWDLFEKLEARLDVLRRKQKHVLYRLGVRKYGDSEVVEYAPGQYIKASEYYWLIDN
ncbi:hypothetical protein KAR91_74850 [Candidatus Pacearchaeota archaeon]|nr:hypothetical protein [Candidatus Pacearchaeota archaeon]